MNYKVFNILLIVGLFFCGDAHAKKHLEDDVEHHRIEVNGWLTSDTYSAEIGYHYMLTKYVGVGGVAGIWHTLLLQGRASGKGWWVDDGDHDPSRLYLRPSVILKSPHLSIFSLYAEPGIMLNVPYQRSKIELTEHFPYNEYDYVSTNKGQWLALEMRLGVSLDFDPIGITVGYIMSNLDTYSMYRHMSYNGVSFEPFYSKKSFIQGAFISASFTF